MNINNSISFLSNNDNGTVTLFAVPVHLIQQQQSSQQQSLILEENVLFKTLPDGSIVLDTNQVLLQYCKHDLYKLIHVRIFSAFK